MNYNYFQLHSELEKMFVSAGINELADIDWIICEVTGLKRNSIKNIQRFTEQQLKDIYKAANQRLKHIPIAYIFGRTEFFGRTFEVNPNVLIPRMDTEVLIECLLTELKDKNFSVLDIGTGSGAIAITLAFETGAKVTGVDISESALAVAKKNAKRLGADVEFIKSDIFENLAGRKFDVIVSNPPYIESAVISTLDSEVKNNEPLLALDGGVDGLDYYRKIISEANNYLNKNAKICFEIGYNQAEAVKNLLKQDYENIKIFKDYGGNDRVVIASLKN